MFNVELWNTIHTRFGISLDELEEIREHIHRESVIIIKEMEANNSSYFKRWEEIGDTMRWFRIAIDALKTGKLTKAAK